MDSPRFSNQSECEDYIQEADKLLGDLLKYFEGKWYTPGANLLLPKRIKDLIGKIIYPCPDCGEDVGKRNKDSDGKCPNCGATWKGFHVESFNTKE